MSKNYSAQGSITIRRLRNGDTFQISLELGDNPLYQGVDPETGDISPDWTVAANQPLVTPNVTSMRGSAVSLQNMSWSYNNNPIQWGSAVDGWVTETVNGRFMMNVSTGALKIVKNLASLVNVANDTLTFRCQAVVDGSEYELSKTIDIIIQNIGSSSYFGYIMATTQQLTAEVTSTNLRARLWLAGNEVSTFAVKWYADDTLLASTSNPLTVTRSMVDGAQLFIAEFYKNAGDTDCIFRAGIKITDTTDEFQVVPYISSANTVVSPGNPVTVTSRVIRMKDNTEYSLPANAVWRTDVMQKDTWTVLKTSNTNSIIVTSAETDDSVSGKQDDVEVVAEVHWEES